MDRIEIKGNVNTAVCYARVVEGEAIEQIRRMCDYPMTEGGKDPYYARCTFRKGMHDWDYYDDYGQGCSKCCGSRHWMRNVHR